jgi:hypothetical protein
MAKLEMESLEQKDIKKTDTLITGFARVLELTSTESNPSGVELIFDKVNEGTRNLDAFLHAKELSRGEKIEAHRETMKQQMLSGEYLGVSRELMQLNRRVGVFPIDISTIDQDVSNRTDAVIMDGLIKPLGIKELPDTRAIDETEFADLSGWTEDEKRFQDLSSLHHFFDRKHWSSKGKEVTTRVVSIPTDIPGLAIRISGDVESSNAQLQLAVGGDMARAILTRDPLDR